MPSSHQNKWHWTVCMPRCTTSRWLFIIIFKRLGVEMKATLVQFWKGKYLAKISRKQKAGEMYDFSIKSLPVKKHRRPLLLGKELRSNTIFKWCVKKVE